MEIKVKYQVEMWVKKMRSNKCSFGAGLMEEYFHGKKNIFLQTNISSFRRICGLIFGQNITMYVI